jgi:hypothetical protein
MGAAHLDETLKEDSSFIAATANWSMNAKLYAKWGQKGLTLAAENMRKLIDLCRNRSIKITVVIYPWPAMVLIQDAENLQVRFWRQFCADNSIPFINLYPHFMNEGPYTVINKYFIAGDVHWNEAGHEYVAAHLLPHILSPGN